MMLSITTDYGHTIELDVKQGSVEKAFQDKGIHLTCKKKTTRDLPSYLSLDDIDRLIEVLQLSKEIARKPSQNEMKYLPHCVNI